MLFGAQRVPLSGSRLPDLICPGAAGWWRLFSLAAGFPQTLGSPVMFYSSLGQSLVRPYPYLFSLWWLTEGQDTENVPGIGAEGKFNISGIFPLWCGPSDAPEAGCWEGSVQEERLLLAKLGSGTPRSRRELVSRSLGRSPASRKSRVEHL